MNPVQVMRSRAAADNMRPLSGVVIGPSDDPRRARMIDAVIQHLLDADDEFRHYRPAVAALRSRHMMDFVFAVEDEPHGADDVFDRIRWGGEFIYISYSRRKLARALPEFESYGFEVLRGPAYLKMGPLRFVPLLGRKLWYFVVRKLQLIRPRDITERFTYSVELVRTPPGFPTTDKYCVRKEVPSMERVMERLRAKFADAPYSVIEKRALKFTNKVFPLFLTREVAMLKILNRDLPQEYRSRVPTLLHMESDDRGYARRMWMNWLRIGGKPLSQLEFARQSTDLLRAVHDYAKIIHLDLRLDNFLITKDGVCFVDFGSAVRDGENIAGNPLLATLFDELMRTSQIQRMLYKLSSNGTVTSKPMNDALGKADKQVDLFYLAVQINQPLTNPDFETLVEYNPSSLEAQALAELTRDILKPKDPTRPRYRSAAEMLEGIQRIEADLGRG